MKMKASAKALLDEGTIFTAMVRFPLLFFQWPYLGGVIFFAFILIANLLLGDTCDLKHSHPIDPEAHPIELETFFSDDTFIASIQSSWQSNMKDTLICGTHTRSFSLGKTERIIMLILSLAGVLENVIPKYIQKKVAQRHLGQKTANRALLFHILAGIISVLGCGAIGVFYGGFATSNRQQPGTGFLFWVLASADLSHQLSILLLIKNHDGIFAVRPGNLTLGVLKFVTLINYYRHANGSVYDIWFTAGFGFLGTRVAAVGVGMATYFASEDREGGLQNEDWYSIGLTCTQLYIAMRIPGFEKLFFFVTPVTAYFFYHELWDKSKKSAFVAWNVIYSIVCLTFLSSPKAFYVAIVIYFYLAGFGFNKKRFYRWPKNALKGTKGGEGEIDKRRSMMRRNSTWATSFFSKRSLIEEKD